MPPTSAGTKVKEPEYKNWLRVGLALYYLKVGLNSFIQNEVDAMHQSLLQKLYGGSAVRAPQCSSCNSKDMKQNRNTYVWKFRSPCLSSLCDIWLAELLTLHTNPTSNKIYWDNCDVTAWPFVPWECAKLYMPRGQPPANTGPAMSDSQALLTLMANCTYFHGKFSQPGITLIKKVSTIRNKVMHSGDMNLSDSDMKSFIQDIIDLLEDPTHLRSLEECKQAVNEINRINKDSVDVFFNVEIEMMALRECVNDCRQELGVHEKTTEVTVESLKEELTKLVQINTDVKETKEKVADLAVKYQQMDSSMKHMDSSVKQMDSSVKQMDSSVKQMDSSVTILSSDLESVKKQICEVKKEIKDVKATKTKQLVNVRKRKSETDLGQHQKKLRKRDKEIQNVKASTSQVTDHISHTNAKETKDKIADLDLKYQPIDSSVTILFKTDSSDLKSVKKQLSGVVKATKTKQSVKVLKRKSDTDLGQSKKKLRKRDKEIQNVKAGTSRVTDYISTEDVESGMEIDTAHLTAGEEQPCLNPSLEGIEYGSETDLVMDNISALKLEEETMKRDGNVLSDLREEEPFETVSRLEESVECILDQLTSIETRMTIIENQRVDRTKLNQRIGLMKERIDRHISYNKDVHVRTRVFEHARNILFKYKHLVLQGKPGEGKTYLALSLAADLMEKINEIQPVQIHNVNEWEEIVDTKLPLLVFLDDILGKYGLSETDLDRWIKTSEFIHPNLSGSSIFLIVCIRTQIVVSVKSSLLRNEAFSLIFNSHVVDISSESNCLTKEERVHMLLKYAPKCVDRNDTFAIEDIAQMKNVIGFPENCKILRSIEHLRVHWKEVFSNNMFLIEEIQEISKKKPEIYTFLVLLMLCGGQLALENKMEELSNNIKLISDYCGLKEKMTIGQIKEIGQSLCGTLVEYKNETKKFIFQHDSIETATFVTFGKDFPEVTLRKCSLKQLSKMCCVKTELDRTDGEDFLNFKIMIDDTQFSVVYERFNEGLSSQEKESFKNIAEALVWKNHRFIGYFSKRVTSIDDVISFVSRADSDGHSLLIHLIYAKNTILVERIIKNISQCCLQNHDLVKRQLLLVATNACLADETDMLEILIEIQENVENFVMFAAASTGNVSVMEMLVLRKGNINATLSIKDMTDLENVIKNCISYPKSVSCYHNVNLFHIACRFGRTDMVKYFMTSYPDLVFKKTSIESACIHFATYSGNLELIKLLSAQVDITMKTNEGINVLHIAAGKDNMTVVKYFIDTIPGLLQQNDKNGWTVLHHAAIGGSVHMIETLIAAGLDITASTNDCAHVLHIAAARDNLTIVKYLIDTNPGLLKQNDKNGGTVLHYAAIGGSVHMIETLIAAGLDITARTNDCAHVLHIAAGKDNMTIVKYLIDTIPGLLQQNDKNGWTVLHHAAIGGSVHMIETLIAAGLDITARTNNGAQVLHIAAGKDNMTIVKYLIDTIPGLLQQNDKDGRTVLHHAAIGGSVHIIETLIAAGLDITARSNNNVHVLHIAAAHDNMTIVKYLIDTNPGLLKQNDKNGRTVLHHAAIGGSVHMIETLIAAGLDITARTNNGAHVLHIAAGKDNMTIVKYLIDTIPGLLQQNDNNGWTVLHYAAIGGSVHMIETLIAAGLDITARTNNGAQVLHIAAGKDNMTIVKYLIDTIPGLLQQNDKNGWTVLHHAAIGGSVHMIETLIAAGLDITTRANNGAHVLHIAAAHDNLTIVKYLIDTNPGLLKQNDKHGWTVLHHAAIGGSVHMIETLIAAGLDITARTNDCAHVLHIAAGKDNMTIVKYLIDTIPGLLQQNDKNGWTVLHHAAIGGSVHMIETLISAGLDITSRTNDCAHVLHFAAGKDNMTIVKYLIDTIPGLLQQNDKNGQTVLHHAAIGGSVHMIETLIAAGLDISARSNDNVHVLHIAAAHDNMTVVKYLIDTNPGLLKQNDKNGGTVLHHAAIGGSVHTIETLIAAGLDITSRNDNGAHVLHIAAARDNLTIVKYLIDTNPGLLKQNDKNGGTVLHYAAIGGSVHMIETLIAAGLDITARSNDDVHVLHIAAAHDNMTIVKYLIDTIPGLLQQNDKNGWTVLHHAAIGGSVHMIETLIAAGLDITARTNNGAQVLHIAAGKDNMTIVKYLIDTIPGLLQQNDKNGWTVLHHAAIGGSVHMIETLIAAGLDITTRANNGAHVLHIAAAHDNLTIVKYLIDTNPGLLKQNDKHGWTVLHHAAIGGSVHMIETLIAAGLDITARTNDCAHVLHIAAGKDNMTIVKYLIDTIPGLLQQNDKNGWTVLHHAAIGGSVHMIETLIAAGLDITSRTNDCAHVLHVAAGKDNMTIVKYLIDTIPGLLQQNDKNGQTVLHHAAIGGSVHMIETLIAAGLDISARSNDNVHVLHIAAAHDNMTVVEYLIDTNPGLLKQNDKNGGTVLHHAAIGGSVHTIETLIAAGLDITSRNDNGAHVLHIAAARDNLTIVKYLIDTNPGLLKQNDKNGGTVLHYAAIGGSVHMIETLIAAGLDITARTNDCAHVLHIAAGEDNMTIVKYLIDTIPGLLQQNDKNGWTVLHHAAIGGSVHMIETLIAAGLDITARTNDCAHVLHIAAGKDNMTVVKYLIDTIPGLLQQNDKDGRTVLHHAAIGGSVHIIETLIAAGLDITARSNNNVHVLHIAAAHDNMTIVKYLIDTNPGLLQQNDKNGWTVLHHAAIGGSVHMIETLIAAGLDITSRTNDCAHVLHVAAGKDNMTIVKYLIDTIPGLLQQNDKNGQTVLHHAAIGGSVHMIETLIAAGLDISARSNDNVHVLHIAAAHDNVTVVKYLIDTNPLLLKQNDKNGWTVLHHAAIGGSVHTIETLIAAGLDITSRNDNGAHVLHIAAARDNLTIVKYLIDTNPGLLKQNDKNGGTVLHYAAIGGSVHMIETLIAAGLDITARTNNGAQVLHIAAGKDNMTIVKYLIDTIPGLLQQNDKDGRTVLHHAAIGGSVHMIETLIAAGLDITARSNDDVHVLHIAAAHDNMTIVKYLIDTIPGLLQQNDKNGWTVLHHAAIGGSVHMIETLIAAGLDITARTNNGAQVLHIAAGKDNMTIVKYLIDTIPGLLQQNDKNGWTVLHHAAIGGSVHMIETLIAAGLDITTRANNGAHVLHIAAAHDNLTIVKYLIDTNPGLLKQNDKHGWTVLHHAAIGGSVHMIETLIAAGLDITSRTNDCAHVLHVAAGQDNMTIVKYLIDTIPGLLKQNDKNGWTVLHHAAIGGSVHMIETLIAAGLDISVRSNDNVHVLHIAAAHDNMTVVKYLIDTNPGLLKQNDKNGWTVLHHAAIGGSVHTIETLIAAGLDITSRNNNGAHVLHIAAARDNLTIVKYLIDTNPGLLKQNDKNGGTVLHYAAIGGSVHMIETLIAAGLDITARTNDCAHVLHIAAGKDNMTIVKYLIDTIPGLLQQNDKNGWTVLHHAAIGGSVHMIETLIAAGLDITARTNDCANVLHIAAGKDNMTIVKYLIDTIPGLLQQNDKDGLTVLHYAAIGGSVHMIETLIAAGLDITARTNNGAHVLHIAAGKDNMTIVKYLIDTIPGLLQQNDKNGWTVLHHAAIGGSVHMIETLIAAGLDITARTNDCAHVLHIAAGSDNLTIVKYLIDTNPGLLKQNDRNGGTVLHHAAIGGSVHMIETLIAAGLDITARTNNGAHVLHIAAGKDNMTIVKYLIDTIPGLLQQNDRNGWTVLHHAAIGGSVHMIESLIAAGLDITARTNNGAHVLHIAAGKDNMTIVKYLIDTIPGLLQQKDKNGWTVLHHAAIGGSVHMIETLIAVGLDITARTNDGIRVLHIAAGNDNLKLARYFIETNPRILQRPDGSGWTALHHASARGSVPMMETMIEAGLDITARTFDGTDVLCIAIDHDNMRIIKYLTENHPHRL